jgi:hypothetical protein
MRAGYVPQRGRNCCVMTPTFTKQPPSSVCAEWRVRSSADLRQRDVRGSIAMPRHWHVHRRNLLHSAAVRQHALR